MDPSFVPFGLPRAERADAVRNRAHLLEVAREMLVELGPEKVTMDGLAERAGLGKGTVFRRFGTRAGIFLALLDEDERVFQQATMTGPPPLGPGADPVDRLTAYGRARIDWLLDHQLIARAALDRNAPIPAGAGLTGPHLRMLLTQAGTGIDDVESLTVQLVAALEGPLILYMVSERDPAAAGPIADRLGDAWEALIRRLCHR